jgi:TrmH RNA methyltransferase
MTTNRRFERSRPPRPAASGSERRPRPPRAESRAPPARGSDDELRLFGVAACRAVYAHRRDAIRKVWLSEARVPLFKDLLAWCAAQRIGYRLVAADDLERLAQSTHHEGIVMDVRRQLPQSLERFLAARPDHGAASLLVLLAGVGNPHNFGAVLRIAAHFGADAVLLPPGSTLALSGAACRVAEGGAEVVPLVLLEDFGAALRALVRARYQPAATVVRGGEDLYGAPLPARLLLVFGAESEGVPAALLAQVRRHLRIPGTGSVESLNIATAAGVIAAEFWRQHRVRLPY